MGKYLCDVKPNGCVTVMGIAQEECDGNPSQADMEFSSLLASMLQCWSLENIDGRSIINLELLFEQALDHVAKNDVEQYRVYLDCRQQAKPIESQFTSAIENALKSSQNKPLNSDLNGESNPDDGVGDE